MKHAMAMYSDRPWLQALIVVVAFLGYTAAWFCRDVSALVLTWWAVAAALVGILMVAVKNLAVGDWAKAKAAAKLFLLASSIIFLVMAAFLSPMALRTGH